MFVVDLDFERLPQPAVFRDDVRGSRPAHQTRRDEESDVVYHHPLVGSEVLAFQMGVDRHLGFPTSRNGRDEIERHHPAALAGEFEGAVVGGDREIQHASNLPD